jgi:signal transduction histidine kinase
MTELPEHIRSASLFIVDDNSSNVILLEKMLKRAGYENIESTTDSRLAREMYEKGRHDLVLLDIRMPHVDGFEVMQQIDEISGDDYSPILVLTAQTDMETRLKALAAGAKDFLNKPVDKAEALNRIRNMLEVRLLHNQVRNQNEILEEQVRERTYELLEAKEMAESASRTKSEFLSIMGHELRTPLNAIIGFSDVIRNEMFGPVGERYKDYNHEINGSAKHLLELINNILDVSNAQVGRKTLQDENVVVADTIESVLMIYQQRASDKGITLEVVAGPEIPKLRGDQALIKRICGSLISNAVKFTPDGGRVWVSVTRADNGGLDIAVKDTGRGIAAKDIPRILVPFGQTDTSLHREHEGIGLGLTLVVAFTELHGGSVEIKSEVDVGTEVVAHFPRNLCV